VRNGVKKSADSYIGLCNLLERLAKRNQGMAADSLRFSQALVSLTEESESTYATDTNDVPLMNEGIKSTARHLETCQTLMEDEAKAWDEGALEDFKRQRDTLVSIRDMFDRRDRFAKDNIPQLERRIEANEAKLSQIKSKPEGTVKPGEAEKVEQAILAVRSPLLAHLFEY
jgi:sorting nexin-8